MGSIGNTNQTAGKSTSTSGRTVTTTLTNGASNLQTVLDNYVRKSENNPNNSMYRDEVKNYQKYVKAAQTMDMSKNSFSGIKAALFLSNAPVGTTVSISGTGRTDGEYTLQNVTAWGMTAPAWVGGPNNNAFGREISTTTSALSLVRGGLVSDNKDIKLKVVKRGR